MHARFQRLKQFDRVLSASERAIALLARCQPKNARSEAERLHAAWRAGRRASPRWTYLPVPDLTTVRAQLDAVLTLLNLRDPLEHLYAQRVDELQLETLMVEAIATKPMPALARRRFAAQGGGWQAAAAALAERWISGGAEPPGERIPTDEPRNEHSLFSQIAKEVGSHCLPFRVQLSSQLSADAATGDGVIFVATGRALSARAARRVAVHEVYGHAWPRCRAGQQSLGLFAVGSALGNDEQEGFALLHELRAGLLDPPRQQELAARHRAADLVLQGAQFADVVELLMDLHCPLGQALRVASRVLRGGGLAREFSYLPAFCRVLDVQEKRPALLEVLGRGRVSVDAAALLARREVPLQAAE